MSLATQAKQREAQEPQFMAVKDIPSAIELDATLFRASQPTPKGGVTRNQYRARNDEAGTVRVRVYHPGSYQDLGGEIVTATVEEADSIVLTGDDNELAKLEWELEGNVLVLAWAPAAADIKSFKVILG
jgi:hypothetical protein